MRRSLQRQLTISHLLVTVLSAGILALLILAGTVIYLRTDFAARWAGETAAVFADELSFVLEQAGSLEIQPALAQSFVDSQLPSADPPSAALVDSWEMTPNDYADTSEWLLVLTPDGHVAASNYPRRFPPGADLSADPLPGLALDDRAGSPPLDEFSFARRGNIHIGQAPVRDAEGRLLGWVYFRSSGEPSALLFDTMRTLGWVLLGALLVAVLVSAIAGTNMARRFSRRLQQLTEVSAAFAGGAWETRAPAGDEDEIAQLGAQFNRMAEQIARQMTELRQLAEDNARLAEEASALAALDERNRLARDLHDAIKQQLFGLNLLAGSIRPLLATDPETARDRLRQLSRITAETLEDMDAIIQALRPASLAEGGLPQAVQTLIDGWRAQTGTPVDVQIRQAQDIPIGLEQALFRVCQEALSNITRHAQAATVTVQLDYGADAVTLIVRDDGRGFDLAARRGAGSFGLRSMQERIESLDGEWAVESSPGCGTTIQARLPMKQQEKTNG